LRAKPGTSSAAADRHLFRHLWQPAELRRNPIVAALFISDRVGPERIRNDERVAEGVRASVRRLADALSRGRADETDIARRRYAIVVEGDLDRAPRKTLEKRLGVSSRQFTRDQRHLRNEIAAALRQENRTSVGSIPRTSDIAQTVLARCAVLAGVGMPAEALAQIDKIIRTQNGQALVVSALCLRSSILSQHLGDHISSRSTLRVAQSLCLRLAFKPDARIAEAEVGLAYADLDTIFGQLASALERLQRALELLAGPTTPDHRTRWLIARVASRHAYVSQLAGDAHSAAESLQRSLEKYRTAAGVLSPDRADFLILTAVVLNAFGNLSESSHYLREAALIAQQNGLAVPGLLAKIFSGNLALACGEGAMSETLLSVTCGEAERLGHTTIRSAARLYLARCYLRQQRPRPARVLSHVEAALRLCPSGGPYWIYGKVTESCAKFLLGDLGAADESARQADEAAASAGCSVLRCSTLREAARVAYAQGRASDAKDLIFRAIDFGYAQRQMEQAAQAHDVAAMITRDANHRTEATALRRGRIPSAVTSSLPNHP
jgi:tetratricopeptide (TPR) repeat protein